MSNKMKMSNILKKAVHFHILYVNFSAIFTKG